MSRSLGVLTLDLIARTGGFEQGMDRASRRVRATANEMESARRVADRMVAGIAAAAAGFAAAAGAMAVSAARSLDATSKMAQQIGTTTEALTGMRFAAQQFANISDQQFDMSMRRMTRRIAEAAEGSGSAKAALEAMGLSARELARLSPDRQMLAIADAMQKTERQADRLRYTMALFDTEGMALVPALQQGAEAFEANIALARQFGVVVSQEAAAAAEEFMTNMNLLTEAQKGFKNQVAEAVLPTLADLSGRFVEIARNTGDMGERVATALKVIGVAAAATATIITSRLIASIVSKVGAWGAATIAAARYQAQMASLSAAIAGANRAVSASAATAAAAATTLGRAGQLTLAVLGGPAGLAAAAAITGAAFLTMGRNARDASVDIDELSESFKTLSAQKLELRLFDLEDEVKRLEDQARESGEILRGMERDALALAESQGVTAEELENVRRSLLEQRDAHDTNNAELDRARTLLNQVIDHLERMRGAAHGAAGGVNALNQAMYSEAGEKYLVQLQGQIKAIQDGGDPIKIATRWISEHADATDADKAAIMSAAHALKALQDARNQASRSTSAATKTLTEAQRAAQAFRREQENSLKAQYREISALNDQAKALDQQISLYGLAESAKYDLAIADLERERAAIAIMDRESEEIAIIERKIELLNQMKGSQQTLERLDAEKQAWDSWARDVEQIFDRVGQSLTDAIFEGGKSGRDLLKDIFKSLTFNVLINPVMNQMQGWVTNQLGGMFGVQNPQQQASGGGFGFSGGTFGAGGVEMAGDWLLRSGLAPETGAKMLMNADAIAKVGGNILGYGKAIYDLTQGNYGAAAGTAIGTAVGGPVGAFIGGTLGGFVDGIFGNDKPTTRRSQRAATGMTHDGSFIITESDSRQAAETEEAARVFAEQAVKSANDLFARIGVDAAINSFQTVMESSILGDRQGVGSSGQVRVGDELRDIGLEVFSSWTKHGVGGWSDAEMFPRLQADVQLTLLEAFQAAGDELPNLLSGMLEEVDIRGLPVEQALELSAAFSTVVEQISEFQTSLESLPFTQLRDLSFDAAANLIQFAGGLEQLDAGLTSYFQNFYSQEEQLAHQTEQLSRAFGELGLTLPDVASGADAAKAAYRSIVESLDLTTEEGQRAYATLMTLSGGFAELVTGMDELADAAARAAEEQSRAARAEHDRLVRAADAQMQAAVSQLETAWSAVQRFAQEEIARLQQSFTATDSAMRSYQSAVRALESEFNSLFTSIDRHISTLRGGVESASTYQYDQARAVISTALVTGQLPQTADLTEALRIAQQGVTSQVYASREDQERAYLRLANEMEAVKALAEPELDAAQATLKQLERQYNHIRGIEDLSGASLTTLESQLAVALATEANARVQIAGIESQLAWHERQYNALLGIDSSITDLSSAMRAFASAASAVRQAQANPVNREQRYYENKLQQMRRTGDTSGGIDWNTASTSDLRAYFASVGLTAEEHYKRYGKYEGLSYAVGTSYVPYDMTANIHKGEIIIDPRSSDLLRRYGIEVRGGANNNKEVVAEIRQLRAELKASQVAIAKNTMKTAKRLDEFGDIGMPVREEATA